METGDGWLLRMRLSGGAISPAQMRVVGAVADECGSGLIDITSRGNLQIRGVTLGQVERAADFLVEAGLARADAVADAARAIVASPLAGHDAAAVRDSGSVLTELLAQAGVGVVPSKFGIVIDDGGRWNLSGIDADVRVRAVADGWMVALRGDARLVGWTAQPVEALSRATALCAARGQRMDAVVAAVGVAEVLAAIGAEARPPTMPATPSVGRLLGRSAHPDADRCNVLAAPFLGRVDAATMSVVADLAILHGAALRFTTDHSIAMCGVMRGGAGDLVARCAELNFSVADNDPRAAISACVGSRGCAAAHADTWVAAQQLARTMIPLRRTHLSACAKSCGAPAGVAQLVALTNGSFQ